VKCEVYIIFLFHSFKDTQWQTFRGFSFVCPQVFNDFKLSTPEKSLSILTLKIINWFELGPLKLNKWVQSN